MHPPHISVAEVRGPPTTHTPPTPATSPQPRPSVAAPVLCEVCCEHVSPSALRGCAACSHRYCNSCVDNYWTSAIYSGQHTRLLCMYGGCGAFATDFDVASVVSHRAFRKMLYFRSRDVHHRYPNARWCAADLCWEFLGHFPQEPELKPTSSSALVVSCDRCEANTCVKCERLVTSDPKLHACTKRKPNKCHSALFSLWALMHTKSCPACATRIQRNHGCSHMTCTRCSSYFCWRCKGFLNNGCPLPGRACICDRVMTAAAYSGLAVVGIIGSPVIIAAALFGGPPYLAYRAIKARQARAEPDEETPSVSVGDDFNVVRARRIRAAARGILQPEELYSQDGDFGSGSTRYTSLSDVPESQAGSASSSGVLLRRVRGQQRITEMTISRGGSAASASSIEEQRPASTIPALEAPGQEPMDEIVMYVPSVSVEACRATRPFVLERRRGSVGGGPIARRSIA